MFKILFSLSLISTLAIFCATAQKYPKDCKEMTTEGERSSIRLIRLETYGPKPFPVVCEDVRDNRGPWLVIQRREDNTVNFYQSWRAYKHGFGDLTGSFWLGLEKIRAIANTRRHELLIIVKDYFQDAKIAYYDNFEIGSEDKRYPLLNLGRYKGNAGDGLAGSKSMKFSTYDHDNELSKIENADVRQGGWWYGMDTCTGSDLNGPYKNKSNKPDGIRWNTNEMQRRSLEFAQMMIRPIY